MEQGAKLPHQYSCPHHQRKASKQKVPLSFYEFSGNDLFYESNWRISPASIIRITF